MKREKNSEFPKWIKTSKGTLVLRRPNVQRVKHKQVICCPVEELGRFALSDFDLLDKGKGEFKVNDDKIKKAVAEALKSLERSSSTKPRREVVKLKDLVPKGPVVGENIQSEGGDEEYTFKHKGKGRYNVFSSAGKKMNTELLDKFEANQLIKSLKG
jgi:hypothetical protein